MSADKTDFLDAFLEEDDDNLDEMFALLDKGPDESGVNNPAPEEPGRNNQTSEQEAGNEDAKEAQAQTMDSGNDEQPADEGEANEEQDTDMDGEQRAEESDASGVEPKAPPIEQSPDPETQENEGASEQTGTVSLFDAALQKARGQETERILKDLREQSPVFSFGRVNDPIEDPEMTFEGLRRKYEGDFNDLEDSKRVRWSVCYGKSTEYIVDANEKIFAVKKRIEASKKFQEAIQAAKTEPEKKPVCTVKCKVLGQKKGTLPSYKELCLDPEEAKKSKKAIVLLPARDGRVYEIRNNEIGTFEAPACHLPEFPILKPGFQMKLPKIPNGLLKQAIGFFRSMALQQMEALLNVVYDIEKREYFLHVPAQTVTSVSVQVDGADYGDTCIHVMDMHSHHDMRARFSLVDDQDEKSTRLYAVMGCLNQYFPEISVRASCNGTFIPLRAEDVFDPWADNDFPQEWVNRVKVESSGVLPCETPETMRGVI